MNTQPIKSSFIIRAAVSLLFTVLTTTGTWAQPPTSVSTEKQLTDAIADGAESIQLTRDIQLSKYLDIDGKTVTIDLNGHKLYRNLSEHGSTGHVIWAHNGSDLTLTSSAADGIIEGGKANNGGAIHIPYGNTVTATHVTFRKNSAANHGGAIWNKGTFKATDCTFENNSAADHAGAIWNNGTFEAIDCMFQNNESKDVGAVYNSVTSDGAGNATLTGCNFIGNKGTTGAGALGNALGKTVMTIDNCIIMRNTASGHGGGVWNGGTLSVTKSIFTNNTANDVGAIYNAVSDDGMNAGTATLTGCTFTDNKGASGAGALANAVGATVMTIDGGTITRNSAGSNGGGIWNGGTLNMKGAITVQDNRNVGGVLSNVFLKSGKVITVTGSLAGSSIGVDMESTTGTFTSGYSNYRHGNGTLFSADRHSILDLGNADGELCLITKVPGSIYYIERSWDDTKVVATEKCVTELIAYDATPNETQQYKEVTNAPASSPNEWFGMGGYSDNVAEFYVVRGNVNRQTIVVQGKDVHLILCDGSTLTLTGGLRLEDDHKLYIHCQSYGSEMGRLMVTNKYDEAAGIGSAQHEGKSKAVGELVIHGGHIEATGGEYAAGIGSCQIAEHGEEAACKSVIVYGGYVKATGGARGSGIGGGSGYDGGLFVLYDGTVIAKGGEGPYDYKYHAGGSGVGGGYCGYGGDVIIYGGTLDATGATGGAGIGGARSSVNYEQLRGGRFTIYGGTVNAKGKGGGAGIGGGCQSGGAYVYIYGGTVNAIGGNLGAGIGGGGIFPYGYGGCGGDVHIYNGTVTATGGQNGAGIGGAYDGNGGNVYIHGGTVTAEGGEDAAGIGGGQRSGDPMLGSKAGCGGNVTITGGIVITKAGKGNGRAIGPGSGSDQHGTLDFSDEIMVGAGNNGSVERFFDADERMNGCWYRSYAEITPCVHSGVTYTINGTDVNGTHTKHCRHCTTTFDAEPHDIDENGECSVCHFKGATYTVTIYLPDADEDGRYTNDGDYKSYTYDMVASTSFTMPGAPQDLQDMMFAGWLVTTEGTPSFSSYKASADEALQAVGTPYTLNGNVTFVARYKDVDISLADDGDNYETIHTYDGMKASTVTLTGRTFYKDGNWNTLCLPFAVTDGDATDGVTFSGTPLEGATVLTLAEATMANSTLTFYFEETTAIEPGKPYLVKWASDSEHPTIVNPVFHDVTISNTSTYEKAVSVGIVTFTGQYAPTKISEEGNITIFYLGDDNTFRYPDRAMDINAFRVYIYANTSLGDVNDDGQVNVTDVTMMVNHILGMEDENFNIENADVTRDGDVTVTDVAALVNLILNGNSVLKMVVNGADGLTFGRGGNGPARAANGE